MASGAPNQGAAVDVSLGDRAYRVRVGAGILKGLGEDLRRLMPTAARAFVAIDHNLTRATIDAALDSLRAAGFVVTSETLEATESSKVMSVAENLVGVMTASRHERKDPVVALGGGIVGDLAGFAASIYRRGVPIVQCPTTLLSMVDASVGGKCGANLMVGGPGGVLRKNMVGTFHQPSLVVCDVETLGSLAPAEFRSGLAECLKHALIGPDWSDADLWTWTCGAMSSLVGLDPVLLEELVLRNVAIKAKVVAGDEREERTDGRGRMCLNMGHTAGHAIETMSVRAVGSGEVGLRHGEAVGLGLIAESVMGEVDGVTAMGTADRVRQALEIAGLPTRVEALPSDDVVVSAMLDDKKVGGGKIRAAIPTGRGGCEVVTPTTGAVAAGIQAIRA